MSPVCRPSFAACPPLSSSTAATLPSELSVCSDIGAARWADLGLAGFGAPLKVTCSDHNGHQATYLQQWDGAKWVKVSDWVAPMTERVQPLLDAAARDYVSKDPAWPPRSEPCDKT